MKRILLVMLFVLSTKNYAQIAVTPSDRGANEEFKKGQLENYKKTTTVFVFPTLYKKEQYEKILSEVWKVTPYKVVDFKDYKRSDFLDGNYSMAEIYGNKVETQRNIYIHTNYVIKGFDAEKFQKGLKKLKQDDKKLDKKFNELVGENMYSIARFPLCYTNSFLSHAYRSFDSKEDLAKLYNEMYQDSSFTNTNLGMIKNYLQQMNQLLDKGEHCGLYDDFSKPEIKNLREKTLYIPEIYKKQYNAWKITEKTRDEEAANKLFQDYNYKFEFIKEADLEKRILNNEEIYYLRYVSMNGNKYLQIVNGKTGEPVYYYYGILTYNLKDDDFKKISKLVSKAK